MLLYIIYFLPTNVICDQIDKKYNCFTKYQINPTSYNWVISIIKKSVKEEWSVSKI